MSRFSVLVVVLACAPAAAQPSLSGRWKDDGKAYFTLRGQSDGGFVGTVRSPRDLALHTLRLTRSAEGQWNLDVRRRAPAAIGIVGRIEIPANRTEWWEASVTVPLRRDNKKLKSEGNAWEIKLPDDFDAEAATASTESDDADADPLAPAEVIPVQPTNRPVVRVLITGFDRFPRPKNHPRWVSDGWDRGREDTKEPRINPAGWAVREFSLEDLDPEFREKIQVELYKCLDVPVTYVAGAKLITDTIELVDADVAISFGVGSSSNVDGDVEKTCENIMDDADDPQGESLGPFQLSPDWPPEGFRSAWDPADQVWTLRYPDNAGVSYNGAKINPDGPDELRSLLPVDRIVSVMKKARDPRLTALDGGWGPGRFICNNVMYRVIETQMARGKLGGFIHVSQWNERKREKYLRVVALSIQESALQFIDDLATETGLPIESPVTLEAEAEAEHEVEILPAEEGGGEDGV